jgi:hypothetical protein
MNIEDDLLAIASASEFRLAADETVAKWVASGIEPEAVLQAVLRFMEQHPDIDYGMPGALAHFIEQVRAPEYNEEVIASIARVPTMMTIVLLNRLINGTATQAGRRPLISCMRLTRPKIENDRTLSNLVERLLKRISTAYPGE